MPLFSLFPRRSKQAAAHDDAPLEDAAPGCCTSCAGQQHTTPAHHSLQLSSAPRQPSACAKDLKMRLAQMKAERWRWRFRWCEGGGKSSHAQIVSSIARAMAPSSSLLLPPPAKLFRLLCQPLLLQTIRRLRCLLVPGFSTCPSTFPYAARKMFSMRELSRETGANTTSKAGRRGSSSSIHALLTVATFEAHLE